MQGTEQITKMRLIDLVVERLRMILVLKGDQKLKKNDQYYTISKKQKSVGEGGRNVILGSMQM